MDSMNPSKNQQKDPPMLHHDPPMLCFSQQASVTLVDVQVVKVLVKVCDVAVTEVTVWKVLVPVLVRLMRVVVTIL